MDGFELVVLGLAGFVVWEMVRRPSAQQTLYDAQHNLDSQGYPLPVPQVVSDSTLYQFSDIPLETLTDLPQQPIGG